MAIRGWVIRGSKDRNSYDLRETYALGTRLSMIRAALDYANKHGLEMHQLDVKTVFLNSEVEEEI